jgi:nitrilase
MIDQSDKGQQKKFKVAALQMVSGADVAANLAQAEQLIKRAVAKGAQLLVLPENFALFAENKLVEIGQQEATDSGPIQQFLAQQAKHYHIWLVGGSLPTVANCQQPGRVRSAAILYNPQGLAVAHYDKLHLFDVQVSDNQGCYQESATIEPGDQSVVAATPYGRLGLAICYDLRFPELFRLLLHQGAEIVALPSAFTAVTGKAHWDTLLRARAIENGCYIIAANQGGQHSITRTTYGGSQIIDPWGTVLARSQQGPEVVLAGIDLAYLAQVRQQMPIRAQCRFTILGPQ